MAGNRSALAIVSSRPPNTRRLKQQDRQLSESRWRVRLGKFPEGRGTRNAMLNCRCDTGAAGTMLRKCGLGELVILLLAIGVMDTGGASPKAALRRQLMQFDQGGDGCAWSAKVHAGAGGRAEHPGCHHDDGARTYLNVNKVRRRSLLAVL